jgi:hypothetical protein
MSDTTDLRPNAFYAPYKRTIWDRLGFGHRTPARQDPDEFAPGWAPSWFIVNTRAHLDWKDRFRVMISGNLIVECAVKTDVTIQRSEAVSGIGILPPGRL